MLPISTLRCCLLVLAIVSIHGGAIAVAWQQPPKSTTEGMWKAARKGDLPSIQRAIRDGIDVNAPTEYGATALSFACSHGHTEIVKLLLESGADVNIKDRFYQATPLTWAASNGHTEIIKLLLAAGADGADSALQMSVAGNHQEAVKIILDSGKATASGRQSSRAMAQRMKLEPIVALFGEEEVVEKKPTPTIKLDQATLKRFRGTYRTDRDLEIKVEAADNQLLITPPEAENPMVFQPTSETEFAYMSIRIAFEVGDQQATGFTWKAGSTELKFTKVTAAKPEPATPEYSVPAESIAQDRQASSNQWPSFRGAGATGIADLSRVPQQWDLAGENNGTIHWKRAIPGLGHSCPVIWDDRIFVTSAVSLEDNDDIKIGQYGSVDSVEDDSIHQFVVYCLDRTRGEILWRRLAHEGKPAVKRHLKSTHANCTPATNGQYVVAFFATEGLYCYDIHGRLVWKKDLGHLDSGWFYDPEFQWGFGSSPVIYKDRVFIQCDIQKQSFVAAYDLATGEEIWQVERDEIPTWSSPTVCETERGPLLITNGTKKIRAYHAESGQEVWSCDKNSEIVVPTPFVAYDLIFIASGYRPIQPIRAIRLDAIGDITEPEDKTPSPSIAWSQKRGGPYMPTPIVYRGFLYICSNSGIVTCYQATTGQKVYRKRLRGKGDGSFVASPIASGGHLYFTSEAGAVFVVEAGPEFNLVQVNQLGEYCLATPAASHDTLFFRTQKHLIAIGNTTTASDNSNPAESGRR